MRSSFYLKTELSASCKKCGANEFVTEPAKPPHHLVQRCAACGLFQKFISKKDCPQPQRAEQIRLNLTPVPLPLEDRLIRLEKEVAGHDRQLLLFTKIILSLGTLQEKQRPEIHIADELVSDLCNKLSENGDGSVREY